MNKKFKSILLLCLFLFSSRTIYSCSNFSNQEIVSPPIDNSNNNDNSQDEEDNIGEDVMENVMNVLVNNTHILNVELVDNDATKELKNKVINEHSNHLELSLHDYGSMEKVGPLGFALPTSNEQISVNTFDVVLYQGNQICFYYESNSWSFTRLGKVINVDSKMEYLNILGSGDINIVISF